MITTLIFDLDGTLLNTLKDLAISCNFVLKKYGFPEHSEDKYRYFVGNGMTKLIERALPESHRDAAYVEQFREEFIDYYYQHKEDHTQPYPGITDTLEALQNKGFTLAVASNKIDTAVKELVKQFFPTIAFGAVYGQMENTLPKPDPKIIGAILQDLQKSPSETILIGDSSVDMQTATNAGIKGIGVQWGFRTKEELLLNGAVYTIKAPSQIFEVLQILD